MAAGEMPLLGPNCYGLINYLDGALLWPDQHGGQRVQAGVALVTQSGNIAINLTMTRGGLPISYVVALGNQACVGMSELIPSLAEDSRVSAIGLLIEGIDDVVALADGLAAARRAGLPVVALRAGQSEAGADLAMSHSASLGGSARLAGALFARHGVGERAAVCDAFVESAEAAALRRYRSEARGPLDEFVGRRGDPDGRRARRVTACSFPRVRRGSARRGWRRPSAIWSPSATRSTTIPSCGATPAAMAGDLRRRAGRAGSTSAAWCWTCRAATAATTACGGRRWRRCAAAAAAHRPARRR
ncbi:MAG: hypothetical protein U5L06_16235 [Rhodovibrio sp.]|nr:hypothetical protein [Rhodovibrio sp.]